MEKNTLRARIIGAILGLTTAAALWTMAAPSVHADGTDSGNTGAIRGGVFLPLNDSSRKAFGQVYGNGGIDYIFQSHNLQDRSMFSVDFIQGQQHGNTIQMIPVTIGEQYIQGPHANGVRPFYEVGAGAYFTHVKHPGDLDFNGSDTHNAVTYGGYAGVGLDLTSNFFVDARYHLVQPIKNTNFEGVQFSLGVRF